MISVCLFCSSAGPGNELTTPFLFTIEEAVIEAVISKHTSLRYKSIYLIIDS